MCSQENCLTLLLNKKKILIKWKFSASGLRSRATMCSIRVRQENDIITRDPQTLKLVEASLEGLN